MEKDFYLQVRLDYGMSVVAENLQEAVSIVKDIFKDDHNIELQNHEIITELDLENDLGTFIERQEDLWGDLQTIEQECLSGNETLVEWLQAELFEVVRLYKKQKGEK